MPSVYRARLGKGMDKITLGYVSSMHSDMQILEYDILGSCAHTLMLLKCKIIQKSDAKKILSALNSIKEKDLMRGGESEDVHEIVESIVIRKAGLKSGGRMHTARSRNDQVSLDMRMKMRDDILGICGGILDCTNLLLKLAEKHRRTIMPLYTHMQQAQTGTLSHYFLAHIDALLRDFERLESTYSRVNQNPLGAGPVGGTSLPIDRKETLRLLGFDKLVENSIDATSSRDFAAEYVCNIAILMTNISRIAEDLVVWSSSEFSFVELSDKFASPSSVMPQKKNPDIMELTRGKTAMTIGGAAGILSAIKGLSTGYGRDLQEIKPKVWSASDTAMGAIVILGASLSSIKVNDGVMRKAVESSYMAALDVAEQLVLDGMPFREAHKITALLVQKAHADKISLSKLDLRAIRAAIGKNSIKSTYVQSVLKSATASASLRNRKSAGSAGFAEQKRMIISRKKLLAKLHKKHTKQEKKLADALNYTSARISKVLK